MLGGQRLENIRLMSDFHVPNHVRDHCRLGATRRPASSHSRTVEGRTPDELADTPALTKTTSDDRGRRSQRENSTGSSEALSEEGIKGENTKSEAL